jgi:hypothetical protein
MSTRPKKPTRKGPPPPPVNEDAPTTVYDSGNFKKEPTTPIQAISMKTPGETPAQPDLANPPTPIVPRPKLRAMSEVAAPRQQNLGHIAPPYDPKEARARTVRDYVIWGCVAIILASIIALGVWFAAR